MGRDKLNKRRLGLYFHIPFCKSKCAYCDFYSFVPHDDGVCERYVRALIKHIESYSKSCSDFAPDTVFIGGGTPTALPTDLLILLIRAIKKNFSLTKGVEFTLEANPATVTLKDLKRLRRAGVNRLSMGLQSADNAELAALSRIHRREDFEEAFRNARQAKIGNINVDVMFGIPGQTAESVMKTLNYVTRLEPEHISFYNLRIEQGTQFWKVRDTLALPGEDEEYAMYMNAVKFLASRDYAQYEISNFAKPGYQCLHNIKYWNCDDYLGLGPAAHSFFNGNRFCFCRDAERYMRALEDPSANIKITDSTEEIRPKERIGEYVMLRMRLTEGISCREFFRLFGKDFELMYGRRLSRYINGGFVVKDNDRYALTPRGMFVSNYILSDILDFDDVELYDPMN
ncbi:MAG: radical SAM family heme chaperone HemW [Clostridia bacterium]|nr:radical SAM family heme chaperone HemW [Clostridia bacterium]